MLIIRRYDEFILLLTGVDGTARLFVNGIMNYTSVVLFVIVVALLEVSLILIPPITITLSLTFRSWLHY